MIAEWLISVVMRVVVGLLDSFNLGALEWTVSVDSVMPFVSILRVCVYFLPIETAGRILSLIITFTFLRLAIRLIRNLLEMVPFV